VASTITHRTSLFLLLLLALAVIINGCNDTNPLSSDHSDLELRAHQLVNQHRASKGLPALTLDATISAQAREHSTRMANGTRPSSHDGFNERLTTINSAIPLDSAAENVAFNFGTSDAAAAAVTGWINSPGHRINIEGGFDITGMGVAQNSKGELYFTQIFGKRR
jgi:uncharacterized protein YkwD